MILFKGFFRKKLNNRGVTLVELICALAILTLVGGSVAGIVYVSTQTYSRSTLDLDVMQESQFASNLINSYIQDAKDVSFNPSTQVLTIETFDRTMDFRFIDSDSDGVRDSLWVSEDGFATMQLCAEKVTSFSCDTSGFSSDRVVYVNMNVKSGEKEYKSDYAVTARNAEVVPGAVTVSINCPKAVVLEPLQSYSIYPCEMVGAPAGSTLSFAIAGYDPNASVSGNTITVGKDEYNSEFTVTATCKDRDGNVLTVSNIKVYVRRVTAVKLNAKLVAGTELAKNAIYEITANVEGTNLDEKVFETGYVSPYQVDWNEFFTVTMGSNYGRFTLDGTPVCEGSVVNAPKCRVKLAESMAYGDVLRVVATARHPKGTNKTSRSYVNYNITGEWRLSGPAYSIDSNKLFRGSNEAQGSFAYAQTLKQEMHNKYYRDTFYSKMYYRYREVTLSGETILSAGSWTDWRENPGDSNDSMSINLRPKATQVFHPSSNYEIELCLCLWDYSTNTYVWPGEYKPAGGESLNSSINKMIENATNVQMIGRSVFVIRDIMHTVAINFNLKYMNAWPGIILNGINSLGTGYAPYELDKNETYELAMTNAQGIEYNLIKDKIDFTVQQKVGGRWVDVYYEGNHLGDQPFRFGRLRYENGSYVMTCGKDQNNKGYINSSSNEFRIVIKGKNIEYTTYNGGVNYATNYGDCDLYNLGTGKGVFYFRFR